MLEPKHITRGLGGGLDSGHGAAGIAVYMSITPLERHGPGLLLRHPEIGDYTGFVQAPRATTLLHS